MKLWNHLRAFFVRSDEVEGRRRALRPMSPTPLGTISLRRSYYLDLPRRGVTHLLAIFGKREKSDLSPAERRHVAALVKELKKEEEKP